MVQTKEFEAVLAMIPSLSTTQLDRLAQEVQASRQFAQVGVVNDELLTYICSFCKKHHLDYRTPIAMRKSRHYNAFVRKHTDVLSSLSRFFRSRLEREAICHLVFSEIRREGIVPMNCVGLMAVIHLLPSHIDKMFPGYEEMGLLPLIARRLAIS